MGHLGYYIQVVQGQRMYFGRCELWVVGCGLWILGCGLRAKLLAATSTRCSSGVAVVILFTILRSISFYFFAHKQHSANCAVMETRP